MHEGLTCMLLAPTAVLLYPVQFLVSHASGMTNGKQAKPKRIIITALPLDQHAHITMRYKTTHNLQPAQAKRSWWQERWGNTRSHPEPGSKVHQRRW